MKKILFILLASFTLLFINSCKQDGNWDDNDGGTYTFKVERDTDFIEKAVGESNDLKLNIKPAYRFDAVKMYIKYTGDKNGVLKLGDLVLEQNKDYEVKNADNILKYTANEEGTHKLKIILTNDKKQSVTEEFELKYAVSDFQISLTGGTTDYYQGQTVTYTGKITPAKNTDINGYTIKFNSYDGKTVLLNNVPSELGKEYNLNDINNFTVSTISDKPGQLKLTYTVKNKTTSRDLELQQNIKQRELTFESINLSKSITEPNTDLNIVGILKKTQILPVNKTIKYKTWVTSATNNETDGVSTTNGLFTDYALSDNGGFTIPLKAIKSGKYTINVQMQDEFSNQSEIKQFELSVTQPITLGSITGSVIAQLSNKNLLLKSYTSNLKATTNGNSNISKISYKIFVKGLGSGKELNGTYTTEGFNETQIDLQQKEYSLNDMIIGQFEVDDVIPPGEFSSRFETYVIVTVYDNKGNSISSEKMRIKNNSEK